jgi:hypothetical protein
MKVYKYVCMYVCTHACMYVCVYVGTYVRAYVRMCICMYVCMLAGIYAYMCVGFLSSLTSFNPNHHSSVSIHLPFFTPVSATKS